MSLSISRVYIPRPTHLFRENLPQMRLRASRHNTPISQPEILQQISRLVLEEFSASSGGPIHDRVIEDTDLIRLLGRIRDMFQVRLNLGFLQSPFVKSKTLTPKKLSFVTHAFLRNLTENFPPYRECNREKLRLQMCSAHSLRELNTSDLIPITSEDIIENMRSFLFEHFGIDPVPGAKIRDWEIDRSNLRYFLLTMFYNFGIILPSDPDTTMQKLAFTARGILSARTDSRRREALVSDEHLYHIELTGTDKSGWIISPFDRNTLIFAIRHITKRVFRIIFQHHLGEGPLHIAPITPGDVPGSFAPNKEIITIKKTDGSRLL